MFGLWLVKVKKEVLRQRCITIICVWLLNALRLFQHFRQFLCGRVTHICVGKLTIIGRDNGFSPGRRQAIIWTNAGILLIGPWGTNFSEILIGIHTFSFKKIHLKMSSAKFRPFCLGLNVLRYIPDNGLLLIQPQVIAWTNGDQDLSTSRWRHDGRDSVSNHQPHDCLLNRLFRRRSKKTSKLRVTGLCAGNSPGNSLHKWPVTRKICPYDDVIMRVCQRGLLEYRYPSETHLKSCKIWLVQIIHFGYQIFLKVCTEHDSDTVVLCVKIQNDVRTE